MANIVGIKFSGNAKIYSFDCGSLALSVGDGVIVETVKGLEYGTVAEAVRTAQEDENNPFKPVVRKATDKDVERVRRGTEQKPHALEVANGKIQERNLPMKLVDCEYAFDGSKLTFYFSSETRVDFRDLVRDLASYFHMRIELRQIGIRDECKMLGGIAPCGRPCCCAAFLNDFTHVTVKMAKNQGLSLNPTKISGLCGRLMCCLEYENDHYVETGRRMPRIGSEVETPDGVGVVWSDNMLKEEVRVRVPIKDGFEVRDYKLADIGFEKAAIGSGSQKFTQRQEEEKEDAFEFGDELTASEEIRTETVFGETEFDRKDLSTGEESVPRAQSAIERNRPPRENGGADIRRERDPNIRSGNDRNRQGNDRRENPNGNDRNRQGGERRDNSGNDRNLQGGERSNRNRNQGGNRNRDERNNNAQQPRPEGGQNAVRPNRNFHPADVQNGAHPNRGERGPRPEGEPRNPARAPVDRSANPSGDVGAQPRDRNRPHNRPRTDFGKRPAGNPEERRVEPKPDGEN